MRHVVLLSRKQQVYKVAPQAILSDDPFPHAREGAVVYAWMSHFHPTLWQPDDRNDLASIQLRLQRSVHAQATTLIEWIRHAETVEVRPDPIPPAIVVLDCFLRRSGRERHCRVDGIYRRLRRWHYAVGAIDAYLYRITLSQIVAVKPKGEDLAIHVQTPEGDIYGAMAASNVRPLRLSLAPRRVLSPIALPWVLIAAISGWNMDTLAENIRNHAEQTAWPMLANRSQVSPVTILHIIDQNRPIGHAIALRRVGTPLHGLPYRIVRRPLGLSLAVETCLHPHHQMLPPPEEGNVAASEPDTIAKLSSLIHAFTFAQINGQKYSEAIAEVLGKSRYLHQANG